MAFPSKPEPAKNGWINRSIEKFKAWAFSRQPIPNQQDFDVTEGVDGVRFSLKKKPVPPEPSRDWREFHILSAGFKRVVVYNGTLFGELPTGFSTEDNPIFELTGLSDGDEIYAAVTWDRTVKADGASAITTRTIQSAATTPVNDVLNGLFYYYLGIVTLGADNIPIVDQARWGPIGDLPGTASNSYLMNSGAGASALADYYSLDLTGKGYDTAASPLAPTYDSLRFQYPSGFVRFVNDDGNLKAFVRSPVINSIGQTTEVGPEYLAFEHVQIDVLVGLRLYGGQLQGKYAKVWVMTPEASSPEWVSLIATTASVPATCP